MSSSMISKLLQLLLLFEATGPCLPFSTTSSSSSASAASHHHYHDSQQQRVFISNPKRPSNRIVSDLMTSHPHLFTLSPHTPVDEAILTLLQAGVSGAPVVERLKDAETDKVSCRLVGFVSSFDFLPREETGTLVMLGSDRDHVEDSETARRILGQNVQDIMTRDPVTVTTNDSMKKAAETMAKHRLHALPVVDAKHGNLVGIVTAKDVMRDVIRMASKALPSEEKFSQEMMSDIPDLAA